MATRPRTRPRDTPAPTGLRELLLATATDMFRRQGFVATTVDQICAAAGATKGGFFHHFDSKEALAEACLARWNEQMPSMVTVGLDAITDPLDRVLATMDFFIDAFSDPRVLKSCLAGTTVQEVSETHPRLRQAANACFASLKQRLKTLLDDACRSRRGTLDTDALATLWMATLQGALVLSKASRDESVIPTSLRHVRTYIASQLDPKPAVPGRTHRRSFKP